MRNSIATILIALAVLGGAAPVRGSLDPTKGIAQHIQDNWQVESGLPQNTVESLAQTPDGYLWAGTELGLARYDGLRFTVFDTETTPQIGANEITALLADRDGSLWIGSNGGGITRYQHGVFRRFTTHDGLTSDVIRALYQDAQGTLWIGTDGGGLNTYRKGKFGAITSKDGLPNDAVFSISGARDGSLWVGTHAGLARIAGTSIRQFHVADGLSNEYVKAVHVARDGSVWIGTAAGSEPV